MRLSAPDGATAEVHSHGAHVTSWRPASDGEERLFLSARSEFRAGTAIRGGVPVIFPQFAAEGPLPRHGFARTSEWTVVKEAMDGPDAVAELQLAASPVTRATWPEEFLATLTVRVGGDRLAITLGVENRGSRAFHFTSALHTYLRVRELADAALVGLGGTSYRVSGQPGVMHRDESPELRVSGEIDRVYASAPRHLELREPGRVLDIESDGFPDAVVWNPGARKAAALPDMAVEEVRQMLCVEAAAVQQPIRLGPGEQWAGTQVLHARRSSNATT